MVKLIVGLKGTGKTKALIELANTTVETSNGTVVVIEKGNKLMHEIKYRARLINIDEYNVTQAHELYGFICGILASDHDAKDVFIDHALKICGNDKAEFSKFVEAISKIADEQEVRIFMTGSVDRDDLPENIAEYV